jgi:hypothetical protein
MDRQDLLEASCNRDTELVASHHAMMRRNILKAIQPD